MAILAGFPPSNTISPTTRFSLPADDPMIEFAQPEKTRNGSLILRAYSHETNRWYRRLVQLSDFSGRDKDRVIRAFQLHMADQIHRELGRTRDAYPDSVAQNLDLLEEIKRPPVTNWRQEGF